MTRILPVEHRVGDLTLRGTAYLPDAGTPPYPIVIMHHGFGSSRTEAFGLFTQIARALVDRGIAAVTFDRAGHGESDGDFYDTTLTGDIAASQSVLRAVSAWPEVDGGSIHLLGMSFGSVIASIVAAESDIPVASLTMISPAAVFADEISSGTLQGRSIDEVAAQGYFDFNSAHLGPAFFDDARDFDVYGRARDFAGPVRILHGEQDLIVPTEYARRYREVYSDRLDLTVIAKGDHMWSTAAVRDPLVGDVTDFIVRQVASSGVVRSNLISRDHEEFGRTLR